MIVDGRTLRYRTARKPTVFRILPPRETMCSPDPSPGSIPTPLADKVKPRTKRGYFICGDGRNRTAVQVEIAVRSTQGRVLRLVREMRYKTLQSPHLSILFVSIRLEEEPNQSPFLFHGVCTIGRKCKSAQSER